jgi:hypothetical protein
MVYMGVRHYARIEIGRIERKAGIDRIELVAVAVEEAAVHQHARARSR